jgi:hypothetical protein
MARRNARLFTVDDVVAEIIAQSESENEFMDDFNDGSENINASPVHAVHGGDDDSNSDMSDVDDGPAWVPGPVSDNSSGQSEADSAISDDDNQVGLQAAGARGRGRGRARGQGQGQAQGRGRSSWSWC